MQTAAGQRWSNMRAALPHRTRIKSQCQPERLKKTPRMDCATYADKPDVQEVGVRRHNAVLTARLNYVSHSLQRRRRTQIY